jgi:hypothetical protein
MAAAPAPEVTSRTSASALSCSNSALHGGGNRDRGAVLVVVKHRYLHALAQFALDHEAFRRPDILQIYRAKGRLQRCDDVDEQIRIARIHLDIEDIDAGEFLEERRLAFHHRLAGQWPDIAQAQNRRAVGDHRDQIGPRRVVARRAWIGDNRLARSCDTRRIGQREIALRRHALGRFDGDFAGARKAVVIKGGLAKILVHSNSVSGAGRRPSVFRTSSSRQLPYCETDGPLTISERSSGRSHVLKVACTEAAVAS